MEREIPKQKRSTRTIKYISEATIQVLDVKQDPAYTTNHIADRAGVAVGTLYRYFPDKGSILRYLVRREARSTVALIERSIDTSNATTALALIDDVLDSTMSAFKGRGKATHHIRVLAQEDQELIKEVRALRLSVARRLHNRLRELERSTFPAISDQDLNAACEAFKAAIIELGRSHPDKTVDKATRSRLIIALLGS